MIIYSSTKSGFLNDVQANIIHNRIHSEFRRKLHRRVGDSELNSWRNSMQYMSQALNDDGIPDDAGVSIEFTIPLSSKRIDFILSGKNRDQQDVVVIVELKQWSSVESTEKDAIVTTRLGGSKVETPHPSYQAWTYARLIEDYNQTVRDEHIGLWPCAYLHNLDTGEVIHDARYADHLAKAPSFISSDALKLNAFLRQHVRYGDADNIMYRIEHGKIRPSKALADSLVGMLRGNPEFVMVDDQKLVFEKAIDLAHRVKKEGRQVLIVNGGPGTGKSVVAVNLLVELTKRELVAQYVSRNAAPRAVYSARLTGTLKKTHINNMFKGSGGYVDTDPETFDALIVDESHRLNEKSGLYANLGENQIKEIIAASKLSVFFLDEDQRVTLRDIGSNQAIVYWAERLGAEIHQLNLESQFRCNGSNGYIAFLDSALQIRETANSTISPVEFDFRVFDNPRELHEVIRQKNKEHNKARMVAGYCWDWASKKEASAMDIILPEYDYAAQWNLTKDGSLWAIAEDSVDQVGCIHTCQGLEMDYIGVIIGPDFLVRNGRAITNPRERSGMDASIKGYVKLSKESPDEANELADRIIKNTYRTLMTRAQKGCYIYCTDAETREYFQSLIESQSQDAGVQLRYEGLTLPIIGNDELNTRAIDNSVPVYDLDIAAGAFSEEQLPNDGDRVQLPAHFQARDGMFVTRVVGESMNKRIPNGAWCLFNSNPGGTRNGKIVLVSHHGIADGDSGERYTIKRYFSDKDYNADGEVNARIVLRPESHDSRYQPIVISEEEEGEFRVIGEFLNVLE